MSGLADSHVGIALAIGAQSVGDPLQRGASAHGIGSGCSRSAIGGLAIVDSAFPASDRRALGAARQIDTGWLASRVFARARTRLIELLRITTVLGAIARYTAVGYSRSPPLSHRSNE